MGSFEEEGELQARARTRDAVRSLRVHVPTARAWRLQVGQRADPGVRHLRRVQAPAAILTRATSRPWAAQPRQHPRAAADKPGVITAPRIRRSAAPLQFLGPIKSSPAVRGARPTSGRHRHPLTPPVSLLSRIEILRADVPFVESATEVGASLRALTMTGERRPTSEPSRSPLTFR